MQPDSPLVRVRKAQCRISEECGNDPKRLVEHYMKLQERHKDRLVRSTDTAENDVSAKEIEKS
jgi:hypothetical protein